MTDYKIYSRRNRVSERKKQSAQAILLCALLMVIYGIAGAHESFERSGLAARVDFAQEPLVSDVPVRAVAKSGTQEKIEVLLPVPVAKAIAERSAYPRTMAALAHTESRGNHHAVGDDGLAKGLFQVWGSLHGAVPDDIEGQVDQANRLFLMLVAKHGYRKAICLWNGTPTLPKVKKYRRVVLAKVQEMER
jgi:hypothetical protein